MTIIALHTNPVFQEKLYYIKCITNIYFKSKSLFFKIKMIILYLIPCCNWNYNYFQKLNFIQKKLFFSKISCSSQNCYSLKKFRIQTKTMHPTKKWSSQFFQTIFCCTIFVHSSLSICCTVWQQNRTFDYSVYFLLFKTRTVGQHMLINLTFLCDS